MWLTLALSLSSGILAFGGVPQIKDAASAFYEANDVEGDVDGALVCRVDVAGERGWDTFGAIDLAVTVSADVDRFEMWGPEDRANGYVSAGGVHIMKGTKVTVLVEDRDVTGRELVARGQLVYDGTLLSFDLNDTQVRCKVVPAKVAQARASSSLARASSSLGLRRRGPRHRRLRGSAPRCARGSASQAPSASSSKPSLITRAPSPSTSSTVAASSTTSTSATRSSPRS